MTGVSGGKFYFQSLEEANSALFTQLRCTKFSLCMTVIRTFAKKKKTSLDLSNLMKHAMVVKWFQEDSSFPSDEGNGGRSAESAPPL